MQPVLLLLVHNRDEALHLLLAPQLQQQLAGSNPGVDVALLAEVLHDYVCGSCEDFRQNPSHKLL